MNWTLTSFLAGRKTHASSSAPTALMDWQAEETERLASGLERAQLTDAPDGDR